MRPCCDYAVVGASEFVVDSYKIRQGKQVILEMMGYDVPPLPPDAMEEYRDEIGEDDYINIFIHHPTRRDLREAFEYINHAVGGFRVINGQVNFPDLPPVQVKGLTLSEAQSAVQEMVKRHYEDAEVFLSYQDRQKKRVELAGLVGINSIPVNGKMRLYDVISQARVPPGANLFMSYVQRDGVHLAIDLYKLMNEGDMSQNIVMHGGDKIFIASPNDATVLVMGEVNVPRAVSVPYGFITLPEAIVAANGIPFTGNRNCIQIIRGDLRCPKIYLISWEHIIHLPNNSMLLMPGDTVFVSEKPITQWNRFISQLLPTCQGAREMYGTYELLGVP
jgi:polysaccharide export outer membrane protein